MSRSKIVITGSTGFLGTSLVKRLKKENISFLFFDRKKHNFLKPETFTDLIKDADVIFHLAAAVDQTKEGFDFNITSTKNLLNLTSQVAPNCRIIFASSFAVYKQPEKGQTIDEKFNLEPRNSYGLSKLKCEQLLNSNNRVASISLRFSNIYGPSSKPNNHSVIANFINQIKSGQVVNILGDGTQERDFLYIDDAVEALILAAQVKEIKKRALNICSMEQVSIIQLISMIEAVLGKNARREFKIAKNNDGGYWRADNALAQKNLNWRPKIKLSQGLQLTISRSTTIK